MEKNERETHDFMNVDSFSQLPFIRPAPVKEKGIRLFGKEFGSSSSGSTATAASERLDSRDGSSSNDNNLVVKESDIGDSSRKFECHYCCRNFPTSQALGGHQNAHKRERQHAKRAHLQSSATMAHGGYYSTAYNRLGATAPPPSMVAHLPYHQTWNNNISSHITSPYATTNPRFYGTPTLHSTPINGSPLGLWRIPSVQSPGMITRDRPMHHNPLPLFGRDDLKHTSSVVGGSSNSQPRFVYDDKPSIQDQVSLDLHL